VVPQWWWGRGKAESVGGGGGHAGGRPRTRVFMPPASSYDLHFGSTTPAQNTNQGLVHY
jgi:hypothetical protein